MGLYKQKRIHKLLEIMLISAYQFTETNTCFDELQNSRLYKLMTIIEENKNSENYGLTEQDEDWIVKEIRYNSYFNNGSIPLLGWAFDFAPICKEYWIKYTIQYGFKPELIAILAPNKEAAIRYVENEILFDTDETICDGEILEIREPENESKQIVKEEKSYLFGHYGTIREIQPLNGTDFTLGECYDLIHCHTIETYNLGDMLIICDEEGRFDGNNGVNYALIDYLTNKGYKDFPEFVGNCMLIKNNQLK